MKLDAYLESIREAPSVWAVKHGFSIPSITRFIQGKRGLSARTIQRIEKITGGLVKMDDLLPPLDEPNNGNHLASQTKYMPDPK